MFFYLVTAQRQALEPVRAALATHAGSPTGFGLVLANWRLQNVEAALRFLDTLDD